MGDRRRSQIGDRRAPSTAIFAACFAALASVAAAEGGSRPRAPKSVVLISSMHCRCSPDQLEAFASVASEFGSRGLSFSIVETPLGTPLRPHGAPGATAKSAQESARAESQAKEYYAHFGLTLPISLDEREAERVGARKAPSVAVLDENGTPIFVGSVLGQNEEPVLKPALEALLAGKAPDPKLASLSQKRFGCAIRSGVIRAR